MTPSECNALCTVFWLKVFVLHSFSFAVTSCKVCRLLLLTKGFKVASAYFYACWYVFDSRFSE